MKYFSFIVFLIFTHSWAMGQVLPTQNSPEELIKNKVHFLEVNYKKDGEEYLMLKKELDQEGKVVSCFQLSLWDAVSSSYTISYQYESGMLMSNTRIQEIKSLFDRDQAYIETFGNSPINEKTKFRYHDNGLLEAKDIYVFSGDQPNEDALPDQSIAFQYNDSGQIVSEVSTSPEHPFFDKNYEIEYRYDSLDRLSSEIKLLGQKKEHEQEINYTYNEAGQLVEKRLDDKMLPHNNIHEKYTYDDQSRLSELYVYSTETAEFELDRTYAYDEKGRQVSGDREVTFEYYPNELIKSETWQDQVSDETITFKSTYTYH